MLLVAKMVMLTACTTMNSRFDCPNQAGVSCKSLDQINNMVDSGQIRGRTQISSCHSPKQEISTIDEFQSFSITNNFSNNVPIRHSETVQRIWIAPYEDTEGNYHQESFMYSIMKDSHWSGKPIKTVSSL